jgi:hypothetical protein
MPLRRGEVNNLAVLFNVAHAQTHGHKKRASELARENSS